MSHTTTLESIRKQAEGTLDGPSPSRPASPPDTTKVCPYCGRRAQTRAEECPECRGLFEPLSRIATQNAMGPWQIRDEGNPFRPGCSIETVRAMIRRGKLTRESVLRGPTTNQFWKRAGEIQGIAHLLGACHSCAGSASPTEHFCRTCGASFVVQNDRNWLGLDAIRSLSNPSARASGPGVEPKPMLAEPTEAPRAAEPSTTVASGSSPFTDVFAPRDVAFSPPSARSSSRESRRRNRAVSHAVAAATVALCAAALSVAVWAASAAHVMDEGEPVAVNETGTASQGSAAVAMVQDEAAALNQAKPEPTDAELEVWRVRLATAASLSAVDDIESLEQAASILREVMRDAPDGAKPADIGESIEAIERRIDDLTIRKFLRDGE